MGSYNSACSITALPIKGTGEKAFILPFIMDDSRGTSALPLFIGAPISVEYFDYGDFKLLQQNPFTNELKPDFEKMQGIAPLNGANDESLDGSSLNAFSRRVINLWTCEQQFLHLFHDLLNIRPNWARLQVNEKFGTSFGYCSDIEGSNVSRGIEATHPEVWAYYCSLMADMPCSYDKRASIVHSWLRDDDAPVDIQEILQGLCGGDEAENALYQSFVKKAFLESVPDAILKVKKAFSGRIISKLEFAPVLQSAFFKMVDCVKHQLGADRVAKLLSNALKRKTDYPDYLELMQKQEKLADENVIPSAQVAMLHKLLYSYWKQSLGRERGMTALSVMCGNDSGEISQLQEIILFRELFCHGFKFSSMAEERQYEGVAHVVAIAQATLDAFNAMQASLYKSGNWEVFGYD